MSRPTGRLSLIHILLAAVSVSVAGMLGFVGLIVPHIMRLLIGSDHEYLLPCAAIAGGAVVTLADTAARTLFSPLEIPVGIFMSFIGGPLFLYLLKRDVYKRQAVQMMVFSKAAGVMFTVNVATGDDKNILIEGAWGLGEYVVQGTVTPDNYTCLLYTSIYRYKLR